MCKRINQWKIMAKQVTLDGIRKRCDTPLQVRKRWSSVCLMMFGCACLNDTPKPTHSSLVVVMVKL